MKKGFFITVLYALALSKCFSQQKDSLLVMNLVNETMNHSTAYENLRYLCKTIGPRLSGSLNAEKAILATAKMLKDAGADTVYLQPCMVPHWIRGEKESGYIKFRESAQYPLRLCALGNSVGTGKQGIEAEVIEVNHMNELHQLGKEALSGKIVFFNFILVFFSYFCLMKSLLEKFNQLPWYIKNPYFFVSLFFVLWMLFFDSNNLFYQINR